MPETAIATPSSPEESSAAKPAPDWRFFVLEYHNFTDDPAQVTDYTITISGLRRDLDFLRDRGYVTILPHELAAGSSTTAHRCRRRQCCSPLTTAT